MSVCCKIPVQTFICPVTAKVAFFNMIKDSSVLQANATLITSLLKDWERAEVLCKDLQKITNMRAPQK